MKAYNDNTEEGSERKVKKTKERRKEGEHIFLKWVEK